MTITQDNKFGEGLATGSSFTTDILPSNLSSALPSVTNSAVLSIFSCEGLCENLEGVNAT